MTDALRQAAQSALDAYDKPNTHGLLIPMEQLRAALAQPQPEAVFIQSDHLQKARQAPFLCRVEPTQRLPDFVPLYAHPPASPAPWVELTEDELDAIVEKLEFTAPIYVYRAVNAALRAKNAAPESPEPKE